jgi:hypothetical protein
MADPIVGITNGVPTSGTGNITTLGQTLVDGANATIGASTNAANAATNTTSVTAMSVWKQISLSIQAAAASLLKLLPTLANGATLVSGTTAAMTGTAATQVIAAVAGQRLYITRVKCINSSGSTPTLVQITDGSGGAVLETLAGGSNFGGEQATGSTPLFWTTAGNGLFAQDVTTGASVIVTASGYSG